MTTSRAITVENLEDQSFTILTQNEHGWTGQRFGYSGFLRTYAVGPFPTRHAALEAVAYTPDLEPDSTRQGPNGARRSIETPHDLDQDQPVEDPYETDMSQVIEDLTWMP